MFNNVENIYKCYTFGKKNLILHYNIKLIKFLNCFVSQLYLKFFPISHDGEKKCQTEIITTVYIIDADNFNGWLAFSTSLEKLHDILRMTMTSKIIYWHMSSGIWNWSLIRTSFSWTHFSNPSILHYPDNNAIDLTLHHFWIHCIRLLHEYRFYA